MPCYDKKLEASRQDFFDDVFQTRDVDCVVTTGELELMMKEFGWDLKTSSLSPSASRPTLAKEIMPPTHHPDIDFPELVTHPGTSSGSYLHSILHHIIETSPVPLTLGVKAVRNSDYEEYLLRESVPGGGVGKVVFKGAKCYGFRNLQNVVRKIGRERGVRVGSGAAGRLGPSDGAGAGRGVRRLRAARKGQGVENGASAGDSGERKFDYVEVMACPGGCVNGGGQLKPPGGPSLDAEGYQRDWDGDGGGTPGASPKWGDKGWTKTVEEAYWRNTGHVDVEKTADQVADGIIEELWAACGDGEKKGLFRTEYRAVEGDVIGLAVKW